MQVAKSSHFPIRHKIIACTATLFTAMALSGCSADITRFDQPAYGFGGKKVSTRIPVPEERMRQPSPPSYEPHSDQSTFRPTYNYSPRAPVERTDLPPVRSNGPLARVKPQTRIANAVPPRAAPIPTTPPPRLASTYRQPTGTITVRRGDTLYGIARRHNISVSALKTENNLTDSYLKTGQTLRLPAPTTNRQAKVVPAAVTRKPRLTGRTKALNWTGSYHVKRGDSLYRIARSHGVSVSELRAANSIKNPRRMRPGVVLRVPGARSAIEAAPSAKQIAKRPVISGSDQNVTASPAAHPVAKQSSKRRSKPQLAAASAKLRWPVTGRIVSGFGKRGDGSFNEGIDISVPPGTDVRAAGDGVVAYAGHEVKGLGKLLLVRHTGDIITAYAHNQNLLVQRGDQVRRGQIIAKSGISDRTKSPELHFEVRKDSQPVNPTKYLSRPG